MKYTYTYDQLSSRHDDLRFMNSRWAETHGGINPDNYITADYGTIEAADELSACEKLYCMYGNCGSFPTGYHRRSMAVSDMVNLWDNTNDDAPIKTSWFCDSVGFKQIPTT